MPDAFAYHVNSATLGQTLHPRVVEYTTRNQIFVVVKDYPATVFRRLSLRIVVYQEMWFLFAVKRGGPDVIAGEDSYLAQSGQITCYLNRTYHVLL